MNTVITVCIRSITPILLGVQYKECHSLIIRNEREIVTFETWDKEIRRRVHTLI